MTLSIIITNSTILLLLLFLLLFKVMLSLMMYFFRINIRSIELFYVYHTLLIYVGKTA